MTPDTRLRRIEAKQAWLEELVTRLAPYMRHTDACNDEWRWAGNRGQTPCCTCGLTEARSLLRKEVTL